MKLISLALSVILFNLLAISFSSCDDCISGNGHLIVRSLKANDIRSIRLSGDANVVLVSNSSDSILLEGESNVLDIYELDQSAGSLKIKSGRCLLNHKTVTITIPVKDLESIVLSGSGNISSNTLIHGSDVKMDVNGSGNIDLQLEATNLVSEVNGSGDIKLSGSSKNHRIQVNGSGNVEATEFASGQVKVKINGSGDCNVLATNALDASIRGSGNVYYKGSPDVSSDVKGSGSVEKIK